MSQHLTRDEIERVVLAFGETFNGDDLDATMACFAEDAVYKTLEGYIHVGREAIRKAFEPQFRGVFGRLRFLNEDLIVDVEQQRAVIRWVCRHDLRQARGLARWGLRALRTVLGDEPGWQGLDVLYLSGPLIREKHSFGKTLLPRLQRTLSPEPWRGRSPM